MILDQIKAFIADLARPFAIISSAAAAAIATVRIAWQGDHFAEAAIFIGAVFGGVSALYIGKAFENTRIAGHTADVEKARAASTPAPGTATISVAPDVDVTVRDATTGDGELPANQRVQP